jgi:hypothetical protein
MWIETNPSLNIDPTAVAVFLTTVSYKRLGALWAVVKA